MHVYWQQNALMDGAVAQSWVKNAFAPAVNKSHENALFLDNLSCQMTEEFHSVCRELASTVVYPLPPDETDKCQPVDQGVGNVIKELMGKELDKYLEKEDNLNKWQSSLSAGKRGILITQLLAETWQTRSTNYPENSKTLFQKTGLLMTANGSDDKLIKPEGFEDYTF